MSKCAGVKPVETYRTVTKSDGTSELDEVSSGHGVLGQEWDEVVDGIIDTIVGRETWLNGREEEH